MTHTDCRGWLGKSKIHRAGHEDGKAESLGHKLKLLSIGRISSSGKLQLLLSQAHPDYLPYIRSIN